MARHYGISGSSISIFLIVVACAAAVPVQLQGGMNFLPRDDYGPATGELLSKYLDDRGVADLRNLDGISGGHPLKQNLRRLDSGSSFGENKKFLPGRRISALYGQPGKLDEIDRSDFDRFAKRNIDEIDRTAFDSFLKRNLDEIDRVGWSGFVKRFDNYLADGHNNL